MMKKSGKQIVPTSTVLQARLILFQPTQRPVYKKGEWTKTSYGRCKVDGRIGQRHADLEESILINAEKSRVVADGGVELLVDPARVRKTMSDRQYSFKQIEKLLIELRAATVTIETPKHDFPIIGGLIDHVVPSPMTRPDPLTGEERHLWKVRLGVVLVLLLENDFKLYYDPAPIARLQHGVSQAVARHILTHKTEPRGGWFIDSVILAVTSDVSQQWIRNARRRLKEDADALVAAGVVIHGNRVKRATPAR